MKINPKLIIVGGLAYYVTQCPVDHLICDRSSYP
jgi:hypothetical protein